MPSKQCRWRDDERPPAVPREAPTRRREEEPVDRRQRGTLTLSTENGEFVPEDDDFQLFEVVRPNAQGNELEKPTQYQVAERDKHEASCVAILRTGFYPLSPGSEKGPRSEFMHPSRQAPRNVGPIWIQRENGNSRRTGGDRVRAWWCSERFCFSVAPHPHQLPLRPSCNRAGYIRERSIGAHIEVNRASVSTGERIETDAPVVWRRSRVEWNRSQETSRARADEMTGRQISGRGSHPSGCKLRRTRNWKCRFAENVDEESSTIARDAVVLYRRMMRSQTPERCEQRHWRTTFGVFTDSTSTGTAISWLSASM